MQPSWRVSSTVFFVVRGVGWENVTGRVGGQNVVDVLQYLSCSSEKQWIRCASSAMDGLSEESKIQNEVYSNVIYEI